MKKKVVVKENISPFLVAHFYPQKFSESARIKGEKILSYAQGEKLLDAGCGCGWLSRMAIKKNFQVFPIDISEQVIKLEKIFSQVSQQPALKIKRASVTKLPFKDSFFDTVLCSEVLEHLRSEQINQALKEFYRVLKPQGVLLVAVPGLGYQLIYDGLFCRWTQEDRRNIYWNFLKKHLPENVLYQLKLKPEAEYAHQTRFLPSQLIGLLGKHRFSLVTKRNLEVYAPFLRSIANFFGFTRDKIKSLERFDGFLADHLPLFFGTDWLFVAKKIPSLFATFFVPQNYSEGVRIKGEKILSYAQGKKLLDAGCGGGWLSRMAIEKGFKVTSIDVSQQIIELDKEFSRLTKIPSLNIIQASITKLPFEKNTFDMVLCSEVLEHLPVGQAEKALSETYRVLKPGGVVIITIPGRLYDFVYDRILEKISRGRSIDAHWDFIKNNLPPTSKLKIKFEYEYSHKQFFSPAKIKKLLNQAGFSLILAKNLEVYTPFLVSFLNLLKITRNKVKALDKFDAFLAEHTPLILGTDCLFVSKKLP